MLKAGTRQLLTKHRSMKGRMPLSISLIRYKKGDVVLLRAQTEQIERAPNRPYCGKIGKIIEVHGCVCIIKIARKKIITSSVHITKIK